MKKIKCVIMDWAGTAVDYGCFAPVAAFYRSICRKRTDYRCGADPQTNGVTKDSAYSRVAVDARGE